MEAGTGHPPSTGEFPVLRERNFFRMDKEAALNRHILAAALLLLPALLAACEPVGGTPADTAATALASPTQRTPPGERAPGTGPVASLAARVGARCDDETTGKGCISGNLDAGDFYEVELLPNCGTDGFFAGVVATDTPLLDTLPVTGSDARTNARLSQHQFACIQAIARAGQQPFYYYIAAISPSSVKACEGREICTRYGERPVHFEAQAVSGSACAVDADGRVRGDCAQGWVDAGALDVFSNGL